MRYCIVFCVVFCVCLAVWNFCYTPEAPVMKGVVVSKSYLPEHGWAQMYPIVHTMSTGETPVLLMTYIPVRQHQPEAWQLIIREQHPVGKHKDCRTRKIYVSRYTYDHYQIGMTYDVQPGDSSFRKASASKLRPSAKH